MFGFFLYCLSASYAGWYAGHELGHTFGRPHPGSGCGDEGADSTWPADIPKNRIGTAKRPYVGFDAGDPAVQAPMQVFAWDPNTSLSGADLMTYCDNVWPGAHNYIEICERLAAENNTSCPTASPAMAVEIASPPPLAAAGPGGRRSSGPLAAPTTKFAVDTTRPESNNAAQSDATAGSSQASPRTIVGPVLSITGQIDLDANTGGISAVHRLEQAAEKNPPAADPDAPLIRTFNASGALLSESPTTLLISTDRPADAPRTGLVSGEVPYSPDISSIELVRGGAVIAKRTASPKQVTVSQPKLNSLSLKNLLPFTSDLKGQSAHPYNFKIGPDAVPSPQLELNESKAPLIYSWNAQGAGLTKYTVQISTDGGKTWSTVAIETSQNSIAIDPSWVEGASELTVRVRASDGIHESVATSAPLDFNAALDIK